MDPQVGDDITVSGTIIKSENERFLMKTLAGNEIWINERDIKTLRKGGWGGRTEEAYTHGGYGNG